MRVFKYVIFPAIALVAMVFSLNAALAQPQATPVTEPESTNVQSRSTLNQPLMTGEPIYSYDYPESIGVLPDADYHFTLDFDLSGVEFEIPDNHISLRYSFERTNTEGASSTATRLVDVGRVSTLTFQSWNILDASLNRDCIANEGWIKGTLNFSISNNQTSETLYTADQHSVNIPCSATVTPEAPAEPVPQCGPGNDEIAIPAQSGVIVQDTGWVETSRTITYSPADWAVFRDGTRLEYKYTDDDPDECDTGSEPTAQFSYPNELFLLTSESDVTVSVTYNLNDEWQNGLYLDFNGSIGNSTSNKNVQISEPDGSLDLSFGVSNETNLAEECAQSEGTLSAGFSIDFQTLAGRVWYHEVEDDIPCTVSVAPAAPIAGVRVCGPNNDPVHFATPPNGVTVDEGAWENGERTVTYTAADWAVFPAGFQTSYTFTDNQPCEATASITGPTSLYLLDENSQLTITGEYDVTSLLPAKGELGAVFRGEFTTDRIGHYFSMPIEFDPDSPANTFSVTPWITAETLMEYCPDTGYEGTLILYGEIIFVDQSYIVWTYEQTMEIPCTVAFTPEAASISSDVCGLADERIIVPWQWEITGHSISWEGNVATITYDVRPGFQVVGGPYTLTVTDNPCITEPVPDPVRDPVCGIENDQIDLGEPVEGVAYDTGPGWVDGVYTVQISAAPGWAFPANQTTSWTFKDIGDCIVTPIPPDALVTVCGPNNDILTIPDQPEGVIIEDSGWVDNERTLTLLAADGYVFPDGTPRFLTSIDENITCEEDPVGTTLIVTFNTSDGGSLENEQFFLHASLASQVEFEPYLEGVIGPGNQIVLEEIIAGTYRLVASPAGYEPINVIIEILASEPAEEHVIAVAALQSVETPTPTPSPVPTIEPTAQPTIDPTTEPTIEPTLEPTVEPTAPVTPNASPQVTPEPTTAPTEVATETPADVTGLPSTGSGPSGGFGILALTGLLAAMMLGVIGRNRTNP